MDRCTELGPALMASFASRLDGHFGSKPVGGVRSLRRPDAGSLPYDG